MANADGLQIHFGGKRVLVTGAGKGIGRETAITLSRCGAEVVAISRTRSDLEELQKEIGCQIIVADLSDVQAATQAGKEALPIDLLVNNAGIFIEQSFLDTTPEAFDQVMNVNLRAPLVLSQIVAKSMIERNVKGSIVNVSSQAASVAIPNHTTYCISKGGLDMLTKMMAIELGPMGIRVNSVNPTVVVTPMSTHWTLPEKRDPMIQKIPLRRFAEPKEVASSILYLLSDLSSMVHGTCHYIDGGYTAQ